MMDKRLNPKRIYRKPRDKTKEGIELIEHRKRTKRKGQVIFHIDRDGNVPTVESREFF